MSVVLLSLIAELASQPGGQHLNSDLQNLVAGDLLQLTATAHDFNGDPDDNVAVTFSARPRGGAKVAIADVDDLVDGLWRARFTVPTPGLWYFKAAGDSPASKATIAVYAAPDVVG